MSQQVHKKNSFLLPGSTTKNIVHIELLFQEQACILNSICREVNFKTLLKIFDTLNYFKLLICKHYKPIMSVIHVNMTMNDTQIISKSRLFIVS